MTFQNMSEISNYLFLYLNAIFRYWYVMLHSESDHHFESKGKSTNHYIPVQTPE